MIQGCNHITLAVTDLERSFSFYRDLLGLKPLVKWHGGAYFLIGDRSELQSDSGLWFCLTLDDQRQPSSCYTHYAFTVAEKDFKSMVLRLLDASVMPFQENNSPGKSFYFLDPDGHKLEIHVGGVEDRLKMKKENLGLWREVE
jgi:catechol 2,3-dioxygenase-like lactoylglutathione lyase family enzyme